jgi:hypothetical protein
MQERSHLVDMSWVPITRIAGSLGIHTKIDFERVVLLWTIALITVALTVPPPSTLFVILPTKLFVISVVGMAMFIFTMAKRGSTVAHVSSRFRGPAVAGQSLASPVAHAGE